jgi:hypothetical protein
VAAVNVEVRIKVVGDFWPGFFQAGKRRAAGQQLGFERAPPCLGLGVFVGVARPGLAGKGTGVNDALATDLTGILAVCVFPFDKPLVGRG